MILNGGELDGTRILKAETVAMITMRQFMPCQWTLEYALKLLKTDCARREGCEKFPCRRS